MRISRAWAAFASLFLAIYPAVPSSHGAEPEMLLFENQPVSSAAGHLQQAGHAPAAVTVVTSEEIRRFGYRTLAEVLRAQRGFYATNDRNYDYVGVRGFQLPGDYNDRILLMVDGHVLNDDVFQTAFLGQDFSIDLEAVDHVEIVRGPGSSLHGGSAVFASINVVTQTGHDAPGLEVIAEGGSFERFRLQAKYGHVTSGGIDFLFSASAFGLAGRDHLYFPEFDDPDHNNGIVAKADEERAMRAFGSMRWGPVLIHGAFSTRLKEVPTAAFGTEFGDDDTETVDERGFLELAYRDRWVADLDVEARTFVDMTRYHGTYVYGSGLDRVKNQDLADSIWVGGELRVRRRVFEAHLLSVGAAYNYHPSARQRNYDSPGENFLDDERDFGNWGVYLQGEFSLLDELELTLGARHDSHYDGEVDAVSPRAALVYSPQKGTRFKLVAGRAFRAPNLFELYYECPCDVAEAGNANLDREQIDSYELIYEQRVSSRTRFSLAIFHNAIEDLIELREVAVNPVTLQYRNSGKVRSRGAELELQGHAPANFGWRASYAYQRSRGKGGGRLSNSPEHLATIALMLPSWYGLDGGLELLLVGPRRSFDQRRLEVARIVNLNFHYRPPFDGIEFSLGLYNLLDHSYPDPASAEHEQDRIPQDGFSMRGQILHVF